jgi:hypothetical protein
LVEFCWYWSDGQVESVDIIVALTKQLAHSTRVFTFGIGSAVSEHLVRATAQAGNGIAEFINDTEPIAPKVMRQLLRATQPALSNVTINWQSLSTPSATENKDEPGSGDTKSSSSKKLDIVQIPSRAPPFFAYARYNIYALLSPDAATSMVDLSTHLCTIVCQATSNRDVEGSDQIFIRVPIDLKETPMLSRLPLTLLLKVQL